MQKKLNFQPKQHQILNKKRKMPANFQFLYNQELEEKVPTKTKIEAQD